MDGLGREHRAHFPLPALLHVQDDPALRLFQFLGGVVNAVSVLRHLAQRLKMRVFKVAVYPALCVFQPPHHIVLFELKTHDERERHKPDQRDEERCDQHVPVIHRV